MAVLPPSPDGAWLQEPGAGDELALLDWLLPGGGEVGGAAALEEWPQDAGAHYARGPTPPAASPPPRVRCLNSKHAPGCAACLPPPPEGQDALYQLRPPPGAEAGEKGPNGSCMLRAQLLATEQWNSRAEREALAAAEEARGDPTEVAKMLRGKAGKLLLKPHMLCLARAWGYASDLWTRRGVAGSSRKRARAAAAAQRPSVDTPSSPHAASGAVAVPRQLSVVETLSLSPGGAPSALRAFWRPAADCFLGSDCRAECRRAGMAFFNANIDAEYAIFDAGAAQVLAQLLALEKAQGRWNTAVRAHLHATARADGGAACAARLALPEGRLPLCVALVLDGGGDENAPVEAGARCLLATITTFRAAWNARRASAHRALEGATVRLDMAPVDAEVDVLYARSCRFVMEALLVLQFLRARGSCDDFLDAAADVAREVTRFIVDARANMADQRAWYVRHVADGTLQPLQVVVQDHQFECIFDNMSAGMQAAQAAAPAGLNVA